MGGNYGENPDPKEEEKERGNADRIWEAKKRQGNLEKEVGADSFVPNYKEFFEDSKGINLHVGKDSEKKREILDKYFGNKYESLGRSKVSEMDRFAVDLYFQGEFYGAKDYLKQ